ncbi:hypothetical protein HU200_034855 [Digitaria exilis]|uniref:F-actin-capping protein subunit beta n=1 Tax=Digitaria exilis TaxID=1010633 RepID=A0A835BFN6_9POAL|nr:hypothetical protein HU200_034855 [Digitaria exilis]CAB3495765.1 unnamed protein product [Digitaria exilis]
MEAAMDLMRRMPPGSAETALNALLSLLPDHSLDLLSQVDLPLQVTPPPVTAGLPCASAFWVSSPWKSLLGIRCSAGRRVPFDRVVFVTKCAFVASGAENFCILFQVCMDKENMKEYILCEYNRDADSYRSPWSNKYDPPLEDGTVPSDEMRNLEIEANEVFSVYRDQYYEGGISSVYIWEDEDNGFIACFLIKKDGKGTRGYMQIGSWDAIHVIQVGPEEEGAAHYCLNSTVMLSLTTDNKQSGTFNLSGSIRRQMSMTLAVADGHLVNMGKMIEEMEGKLRNSLDQVYFGKTREMVCTLRPPPEVLNMRLPDS